MDVQVFWEAISAYNRQTAAVQAVLLTFLLGMTALSYAGKVRWAAKCALGVVHLFLAAVFFARYGRAPIQLFFALPLFLACGLLFLYECRHCRSDELARPDLPRTVLLILCLSYPLCSLLAGNAFPQMVTSIMPCPVVSFGIVVYSGYSRKNRLLLALLTLWGLTGIKSLLFHVYEDLILLLCGLYGARQLLLERRRSWRPAETEFFLAFCRGLWYPVV